MIQICLHLSLEAHHHKEFIFLQHSVSSIKGIAPYCPSLAKFFRKMLFIKWHRNYNVRTTSKLFTMTQELRILPLPGQCKQFRLKWRISWRQDPIRSSQRVEEYIAATAPTFTTLPRNTSPAQMTKQCNLKKQAVTQYPRRTLQWCLLNLRRRRCLMGQGQGGFTD